MGGGGRLGRTRAAVPAYAEAPGFDASPYRGPVEIQSVQVVDLASLYGSRLTILRNDAYVRRITDNGPVPGVGG